MFWVLVLDALLWVITLVVSVLLARQALRRRDVAARLFGGIVLVLLGVQAHHMVLSIATLDAWAVASGPAVFVSYFARALWPLDVAILVLVVCQLFHFCLVFPVPSGTLQARRWIPLLFYLPGCLLMLLTIGQMFLGFAESESVWGHTLDLANMAWQIVFVVVLLDAALVRLLFVYKHHGTPVTRQQLAWIFCGFVLDISLVLLVGVLWGWKEIYAAGALFPGLGQVITLVLLGAFSLSIYRYRFVDLYSAINYSITYVALLIIIVFVYFATASALGAIFQALSLYPPPSTVMIPATMIAVFVALPLRDVIHVQVDKVFPRDRVKYARLLQEHAQTLLASPTIPRLLDSAAELVQRLYRPSGIAVVLAEESATYRVILSRGELAHMGGWQESALFLSEQMIPEQLARWTQPFYLPWHTQEMAEKRIQAWRALQDAGVHLLVPMHKGGGLFGWLALGPKRSDLPYTRRELDFLAALMTQSCMALENARLNGDMQRRATELALVAMVSSAISSSLDLEQVLETIVESVIQVVGCDKSAIFELTGDGCQPSLLMARGFGPEHSELEHHLAKVEDCRPQSAAFGDLCIIPDARKDPRFSHLAAVCGGVYRAIVDIPLAGRGGLLGVLSVFFDEVHTPTVGELEVLTTFAGQAAIAIENARLYAEVTRERDRATHLYLRTDAALAHRVEELTVIGEISRQLTSTLDMQKMLHLMLDRALRATDANRGLIATRDPITHQLRILADRGYPATLEQYGTGVCSKLTGITGRTARSGESALVPDVTVDPYYFPLAPSTAALLSVPIFHEEEVIGVITLESDIPTAFTEDHVHFAQLLAEHAVIGINNARLFAQVTEARDRLEAVLNSTHDLVVVTDTLGQIILTNRRVRELFGHEVEEWLRSVSIPEAIQLLDSHALPMVQVDVGELAQALWQVGTHSKAAFDISFSYQMSRRQHYVEGVSSPMLNAEGEVAGWVVVMREVTERKELERFREDLTSMVIHNLQGPLAALISSLQTLQDDRDMDADMSNELLDIALMSGQRLYDRIESLLWIRRLEERRLPLNLQAMPLWAVVQPVMDEYMSAANADGIELVATIAEDLPLVRVDEDIIGRVFSNLLDNALKHVPAGGRVQVGASLEHTTDGPMIRCSVADTGPGIDESLQGVLFEKFRRGASSPRGQRNGMGIGLHYCKVAVEAHKGMVWVESEPGNGCTFYLTLPLASDDSARRI